METLAHGTAKKVGQFIKTRRRGLGLSRAQLARRMGFVLGSYVSHIERGDARIAPNALNDWARALELEPQAFRQQLLALGETAPSGFELSAVCPAN